MCVYGIGLPFEHPIWQSLPPCRCGAPTPNLWKPLVTWDEPSPTISRIPAQCPDCQTWFVDEHRCDPAWKATTSISSGTTSPTPDWLRDAKVTNTTA